MNVREQMTTKYIIKNCPAFDCKYNECHSKIGNHKLYCMDCTDCLLKQIVEKCWDYENTSNYELSEEILSILEIQECE